MTITFAKPNIAFRFLVILTLLAAGWPSQPVGAAVAQVAAPPQVVTPPGDLKAYTDYADIVYIDPATTTPGDGSSPDHPLPSWSSVVVQPDTAYVQKRGTTALLTKEIRVNQNNVLIGAYGLESDPRPILSDVSANITHLVAVQADFDTIRDLEIVSPRAVSGIHFAAGYWPSDGVAWNCYVHGVDQAHYLMWGIRVFGERTRVLNNVVEYTGDDGIFVQYFKDIEIGYNRITHVNQKWFEDPAEPYASGDGIQFDTTDEFYIHHNYIDRSDTGNKFCIIVDPKGDAVTGGLIEYNVCKLNANMAGIFAGGASVYAVTIRGNSFEYVYADHEAIGVYCHARYPTIYNNVFVGMGQAINLWNGAAQAEVHHNTFYDIGSFAVRGDVSTIAAYNNLFAIPEGADAFGLDGLTASHNLFVRAEQATGDSPVVGEPRFVDAATGDFHLLLGSAAVDAGMLVPGIDADADGNRRDAAPDIGAYELQPALFLWGRPDDQAIHLAWETTISLPITATWTIRYEGPMGDDPSPITGIPRDTRAFSLTGLTNATWYTVTLVTEPALLTESLRLMPTDHLLYLPLITRK